MGQHARRALAALTLACAALLSFPLLPAGVVLAQGAPGQPGLPAIVPTPQVADAGLGLPGTQGEVAALAEFGAEIRFQLRLRSPETITSVLFLYQVDDSTVQNTAVPSFQPGTSVLATYGWRVANVLVPGAEVRYQWLVETAGGQRATTAEQKILYQDTRFTWREVQDEGLTVTFPSADPQAGSALLDEAKKAQARLKADFGLTVDRPLRIYAYSRREDYATAVYTGRPLEPSLTVGADRIFVLAPGGTSGMTTAIQALRREIATALFVQKTKNAIAEPPRWLATGFSFVMSGEELPAETTRALGQLAQANRLLSLKSLSGNFPSDEQQINLAYAESASAVQYITGAYGPDKLRALLTAFKDGNSVDEAMKKGLGVTLDQFETRWKNALKSGQVPRAPSGQGATQPGAAATGNGGLVDRMFGPATRFWQGVFGEYTGSVLIGVGGVLVLGVTALVVGSGVSIWRRARAEDE